MSAHTPGLLFVAETGEDDGCSPETVIRGMGGRAGVAVAIDFGANNPGMREANAQRLAACWNAFDGISPALLDCIAGNGGVSLILSMADQHVKELYAARALLREVIADAGIASHIDACHRAQTYLDAGGPA